MSTRSWLASALLIASCTPPALAYSCQSSTTCGTAGPVQTCCTRTQCEYRVGDGSVFPCTGIDCSAAESAVALYCAPLCPDAGPAPDASVDAASDAAFDAGADLDALPCVR